ncbi:unknown [Candidatus Apopatosoma intestinale]|nr:unknown [Candidatus Apopatosoma intestinale]
MLIHPLKHHRYLILACHARKYRPAERIEEIRAVYRGICRKSVAACAEVSIAAVTLAAEECARIEIALPAMLSYIFAERGAVIFKRCRRLFHARIACHFCYLVVGNFQKECVHYALGMLAHESVAVFAALRELCRISLLFFDAVYPVVIELQAVVPV